MPRETQLRSPAIPAATSYPRSAAEAQPLRITAMKPVGNYAYSIDFSDGHNTAYLQRSNRSAQSGEAVSN